MKNFDITIKFLKCYKALHDQLSLYESEKVYTAMGLKDMPDLIYCFYDALTAMMQAIVIDHPAILKVYRNIIIEEFTEYNLAAERIAELLGVSVGVVNKHQLMCKGRDYYVEKGRN